MTDQTPYRVGCVLIDGFALMSYSSVIEPLRIANLLSDSALYDIRHLPGVGASSTSSSGAVIKASAFIGEQVDFDLLFVFANSDPVVTERARLYEWLSLLANRGVLMGGISGGTVLLAKAGIMEKRRLAAHRELVVALASVSPTLVIENTTHVWDRDRLTCLDGTAALEMMHALISEHHGPGFAGRVSDWYSQGNLQAGDGVLRSRLAERYQLTNPSVLKAIEAMENHIADPLDLDQLARQSGIGARQLNRVFKDRLGVSTISFYRYLRLEKGHALVLQTGLSMSEVAAATGFTGAAHFSTRFRQRYGLPPSKLRRGGCQKSAH
ncbi:MAG: helix-turn-helix domain-containing protein [Granulosicoccus sp.]